MKKKFKNKSSIIRAEHTGNEGDKFVVISENWNDYKKLNGYERAIMLEIMSNDNGFVIHKRVIQKRLGFGKVYFNKAWNSLIEKGFIFEHKNGMIWEYCVVETSNRYLASKPPDGPFYDGHSMAHHKECNSSINSCDVPSSDYHTNDYLSMAHKLLLKRTSINLNQPEARGLDSRGSSTQGAHARSDIESDFSGTDTIHSAKAECSTSATDAGASVNNEPDTTLLNKVGTIDPGNIPLGPNLDDINLDELFTEFEPDPLRSKPTSGSSISVIDLKDKTRPASNQLF